MHYVMERNVFPNRKPFCEQAKTRRVLCAATQSVAWKIKPSENQGFAELPFIHLNTTARRRTRLLHSVRKLSVGRALEVQGVAMLHSVRKLSVGRALHVQGVALSPLASRSWAHFFLQGCRIESKKPIENITRLSLDSKMLVFGP
jgi:hypothetical protein